MRDREYREALLTAQAAQARLEASNAALELKFYKLCLKYKLDPEKSELSADAKGIHPKTAPTTSK